MSRTSGTAPAANATQKGDTPSIRPRDLLSKEDCLEIFRQLYLARYFDVRLIKEKRLGHLTGTLYSSHNQEGVLVGSLYGLKPNDWISPIHRDMPAFFLKDIKFDWRRADRMGLSIEEVCAQVWGRVGSPGRARDNWSHIGSRSKRIIHSTSMLAGTIPVAAGVVYADRLDGGDAVCVTFNGEGSTAQGIFHEAINYAAVHKLPVVTVVENNQWAYGTPAELECPTTDVADRARGFGIPGLVADGQDVFDVYDKVMTAINYARSGRGPSIVECKTFRAYGHGDHDDDRANKYRPKEDVEKGRARDPIAICRATLLALGHIDAAHAETFRAEGKNASEAKNDDFPPEVVTFLNEGIEFALQSSLPPADEGAKWVFREAK
ncbi:MAG: thiamine pyrophosphate-dependent dehydrogenase E1 component subunit alpha [Fimbriimonas sp.]|nr:thiamine pyrophosphate-dependent dehydrogenase E1 component subunit alpha [Fimbriimonas sp.]